jgi:hypothetical protein
MARIRLRYLRRRFPFFDRGFVAIGSYPFVQAVILRTEVYVVGIQGVGYICSPFAFGLALLTPLPIANVVHPFRFRFSVAALDLHHANSKGRPG